MKEKMKKYAVGIGDRWWSETGEAAPDETCGHRHRTAAAAEGCRRRLLNEFEAKWYNSFIFEQ